MLINWWPSHTHPLSHSTLVHSNQSYSMSHSHESPSYNQINNHWYSIRRLESIFCYGYWKKIQNTREKISIVCGKKPKCIIILFARIYTQKSISKKLINDRKSLRILSFYWHSVDLSIIGQRDCYYCSLNALILEKIHCGKKLTRRFWFNSRNGRLRAPILVNGHVRYGGHFVI